MNIEIPEAYSFLFDDKAEDGSPVRYRAAFGGRASAKSHSFVRALVLKAHAAPLFIGCYREIQKSIKDSVKKLLDDVIDQCGFSPYFESTDTEIRGKNGSLFIFGGLRSNPDSVKSTEGLDIAAVFEANRVSQRSWDLLTPTVRKAGSEIWAEWNPEEDDDPVDAMFRGPNGAPPGAIARRVSWRDNPWFPDVLRAEMEWDRRRDFDKYQWVWEGEYRKNSEAQVFKNWRVEPFEAPSDAVFRFGADWGFAVDPTVLVRCYIDGRTLFVDYEAYMVGCEIDDTPQLFDAVPGSRRHIITADSARPETVSYMQRQGFKIVAAIKGPGSIEDGVEFLKSYDILVHPRCAHVIAELGSYSHKRDKLTGAVLPDLADKDNNCIDALRYACEGARRAKAADAARPKLKLAKPPPILAGAGSLGWMR